jgi:putative restriction endonuclease
MVEIYIGNTDNNWFDFLQAKQPLEEVNFWKPTPTTFKAINEGGLFAFRLKSPRGLIGGYGVLASAINVSIQFAWDGLGQSNGCPDLATLVSAIQKYRKNPDINAQSLFGCRVLVQPVFFDQSDWFDLPEDWSSNIVSGKTYNTSTTHGQLLFEKLQERTNNKVLFQRDSGGIYGFGDNPQKEFSGERFGQPKLIHPRLGQASFRIKVADAYMFECGLSETKVLPALDAAHVRPYSSGGTHSINNGILLRRGIHSVLDSGYATFDNNYQFVVSDRVRTDFNNGNEYRRLHGSQLKLPANKMLWPSQSNLEWHRNECFKE